MSTNTVHPDPKIAAWEASEKEKFDALKAYCEETYELGYEMLWQGVPE